MKETRNNGKLTLSCYQIVLIADPYSDLKMLKKHLETPSIKGLWNNGPVSMRVNLLQN